MLQKTSITPQNTVRLTWEDSATRHGWLPDSTPMYGTIKSAGLVVANDKDQLTITTSINDEGTPICPLSIPWSCIVEAEVL